MVLSIVILKIYIYFKTVKPKNVLELISMGKTYKKIVYNRIKKSIIEKLKQKRNYNVESINILSDYYKNLENPKVCDVSRIINGILSFSPILVGALMLKDAESISALYKLILHYA